MGSSKKSQSWSVDVIIGVIVFMVAFFIFYGVLETNPETKTKNLKQEASSVIEQVASESGIFGVINGNEINETRMTQLKNSTYEDLAKMLRAEDDFCIYLEDENGNIIIINESFKGIGSSNINISGTPCSQK